MKLNYIATEADSGKTVKYILKNRLGISEKLIIKMKFNSRIHLNSMPVFVNAIVQVSDVVDAFIDFADEDSDIIPESLPIEVIYEDESMVILNKQANIVVHPTFNHPSGTIANALMYHLNGKGINKKIRPVSRLDRDTTGIIVFAMNAFVQDSLIHQMQEKIFKKEYLGIVQGIVKDINGTIDLPISRKPDSIMERHISESGDKSVTHYETLEKLDNASLLKFRLETGRTHQIRVHCQAIGHPLIGDTLYSEFKTDQINRQALHSHLISFIHPLTRKKLEFSISLPQDMKNLLEILRK